MLIQNVVSYEDFSNYMKNYKYVIVNISASWCKPCVAIKPKIEKFVSVIDESDYIYLKIDNSVYEEDSDFDNFFALKKIPYFAFIKDNSMIDSFVNGDFDFVSQKIMLFIKVERELEKKNYSQLDKNDDF
jgi:thiol-disulfide isomerase/thioredoxin